MLKTLFVRTSSVLAFGAAVAWPVAGSAQGGAAAASSVRVEVPPIQYKTRTLANGLRVYALHDPRTANVSVQMWYDVGSKDDPAGRSGFAHLFEHILSRVTRNIPHGQLSRLVEEEAGGTRNASTGPDTTNYYETVPANQLEAMLWAHAERMGRSVLDQEVFEAERNIVKEEMRQRVLSQPYGRLQRYHLFQSSFERHPYDRSGIGTMADLDAASLDDARAFHANFYRPDNAVLIVAGNFDQKQLDAWVDEHLGAIPRPSRPILRHRVEEPVRTRPQDLVFYGPNVPLPALVYSWQRPKLNHPDSAALSVLDRIMSGGQSSRLFRSLVYDKQLAQSAGSIDFGLEQAGLFVTQAILASGKDMNDLQAALSGEVARLRTEPVSAAELAEAKTELVAQILFDREAPEGRADEVGGSIMRANDPRWEDKMLAAVQKVSAADVQRVARQYLRDERRVSIRYLDQAQRSGEAATDPSAQRTDLAFGRQFPAATGPINQLAPDGERMAPPAPTAARPFAAPSFAERRLANGLRVVVARSTDLPLASAYLVFGGGSSADPSAKPGVANMTANLVDDGAAGMTAPEIAARIESLGGNIGSSASLDSSLAFVAAPTATIEAAGQLLSQIVRDPAFAETELAREKRRSLDRLRVSMRDPAFVNQVVTRRAAYGDAAYGAPTIGTPDSLSALTRADLADYHRRFWRPDNATLIITGGLQPEAGFALAEKLFSDWTAPQAPLPDLPANRAGQPGTPRVIVIDMPDADQSAVSVVLRAAPRSDPAYYPLLVANNVLGGSSTARLFQEVRVKRALSYGAYSSLPSMRDEGVLSTSAQTRNDAVPEVVDVMLAEIKRLASEPVDAETLAKRRTLLAGAFGRNVETTPGLGGFLAGLAGQGLPMSEYGAYLARIQAVTPDQISRSVAAELDPAKASIIVVGRASEFLPALKAKHSNVEVIPLAQLDLASATLRRSGAAAGGQK